MYGLHFLLEAPQLPQTHKKCPLPLSPCDNCRVKIINCAQVKSQLLCSAGGTGSTPCQFRDQERYFAERSRKVARASAGPSAAPSKRSPSQSNELSEVSLALTDSNGASRQYWGPQASLHHGHTSPYASSSPLYDIYSCPQSNTDQWFSSPLMESAWPHHESGGQHSYTSSLLQIGNDSLRGYYTSCGITDTPNSPCNRMLDHVLPPSNSHQVNMSHLTMHVHRQNGSQSPNYLANGPKPFYLAGSSSALEVTSSSAQRVAPNSNADPDAAITQPSVDAVLGEDRWPPAERVNLNAKTPPLADTHEYPTHFPHMPAQCNADSLAMILETASPYRQSPSPGPHTIASHLSQLPSSPGSLSDVFTANSQPWLDVAIAESDIFPEAISPVETDPESTTIQQERTRDIRVAEEPSYCHHCRVSFTQPRVFRRHLKDKHEQKESCTHCSNVKWSRGRPYLYRRHLRLKHPEVTFSKDQLRRARKSRTVGARQRNRKN